MNINIPTLNFLIIATFGLFGRQKHNKYRRSSIYGQMQKGSNITLLRLHLGLIEHVLRYPSNMQLII